MDTHLFGMAAAMTLVGAWVAYGRPNAFPVFLLAVGTLRFGSRAALGGVDLSAVWLLGLLVLTLVALFRLPRRRVPLSTPEGLYLMFLAWCFLEGWRADDLGYALRVFLKLLFPFLVLALARRAAWYGLDVRAAVAWLLGLSLAVSLVAGGVPYRFLPRLASAVSEVLWNIAAVSDHLSLAGVLALVCWRRYRRMRHLALAAWFGLSSVVVGNRTGIIAFAVGAGVLVLLTVRKRVALPVLAGGYVAVAASLFALPHIRERMFYDPGRVDPWQAISRPHSLSLSAINSHGRFAMWETVLRRFFVPNPAMGCGLGTTQAWFYRGGYPGGPLVEHSSYVRLLAEAGLVGCSLFVAAMASSVLIGWRVYRWGPRSPAGLCGLYTACAFPALMVCMAFDNLINYALPAGQYPFAFAGMALGLAEAGAGRR